MVIALKPSTATAITYTNCCSALFDYENSKRLNSRSKVQSWTW